MKINADLTKRAEVHTPDMEWVPSPVSGVLRRMLDRDGGEVARSTTVVRFEPGAWFPEHTHGGGEEPQRRTPTRGRGRGLLGGSPLRGGQRQ